MALSPTIYKARILLSDLDRNHYQTLNLTVAQHPSETLERMMVRVLAFCINADQHLAFSKGLSEPDEPDISERTFDGQTRLWIDVGEPVADRIKKATRVADAVKVYSFNTKSASWWRQEGGKFAGLNAEVYRFQWEAAQALAAMVERTMDISVTISGNSAYVAAEQGACEMTWETLQA